MKFEQLKRKSIPAGQNLRVRLARLEDQDFVERMNAEAGAPREERERGHVGATERAESWPAVTPHADVQDILQGST
jgi:hypothetical protein